MYDIEPPSLVKYDIEIDQQRSMHCLMDNSYASWQFQTSPTSESSDNKIKHSRYYTFFFILSTL